MDMMSPKISDNSSNRSFKANFANVFLLSYFSLYDRRGKDSVWQTLRKAKFVHTILAIKNGLSTITKVNLNFYYTVCTRYRALFLKN